MNPEQVGKTQKVSAAETTLMELERVAKKSTEVAQYVAERTSSIANQALIGTESADKRAEPTFPTLFSRIRELTSQINNSLVAIEDSMSRLEL